MARVTKSTILFPIIHEIVSQKPGHIQPDIMVKVWAIKKSKPDPLGPGFTPRHQLYIGRALLRYWEQCCGAVSIHAPQVARFGLHGEQVEDFGTHYTLPDDAERCYALMTRALARAVWGVAFGKMSRSTIVGIGRENNDNVANLFDHLKALSSANFLVPQATAIPLRAEGRNMVGDFWADPQVGRVYDSKVGCMENFGYNRGSGRQLSIWTAVAQKHAYVRKWSMAQRRSTHMVPAHQSVLDHINCTGYWSYGGGITRPASSL